MDTPEIRYPMNRTLPMLTVIALSISGITGVGCERRPKLDYDCSPGNYRQEMDTETWCVCVEYHWRCGLEGSGYAELSEAAVRASEGSGGEGQ